MPDLVGVRSSHNVGGAEPVPTTHAAAAVTAVTAAVSAQPTKEIRVVCVWEREKESVKERKHKR